jgi:hypothetical protein
MSEVAKDKCTRFSDGVACGILICLLMIVAFVVGYAVGHP